MSFSIIRKMCKQTAVYWEPMDIPYPGNTNSDDYGRKTYKEPREIRCRAESEDGMMIGPGGRVISSGDRVYALEDLENGGVICVSVLADIEFPEEPMRNPGAVEIKKFNKLPTLNARKFLRWGTM